MRSMSPFLFVKTGSAETHTKPCKTSPQGTSIKRPAIYWDHAVSWGGGVWVSVSDIGRVGKKMVLRRIPIYFLSTIFHDLKPKLASKTEHNWMQKHQKIAYAGPKASPKSSICQSIIACATPAIRKKKKHEKKKKSRMDKGLPGSGHV